MASNEKSAAPGAVWYFVGATFVAAIPMIMFPEMPWPVRVGTLVLALALIAGGGAQLRREKREGGGGADRPPQGLG